MANAAILSAQEQAIESGKTVVHGTVTDRVLRLYKVCAVKIEAMG